MKLESFAYWLQGFFEISNAETLTAEQVNTVKNHLNLVFKHDIDPKLGDDKHQKELNLVHNGFKPSGADTKYRC